MIGMCVVGGKYNSLLERYKQQVAKCAEECAPRYDGLKKKYTDECAERRRLYNELIELRGNIRVFCRCRPLSTAEISNGCSSIVQIDPSHETELQFVPSDKDRKAFKFDHVFGPSDNQGMIICFSLYSPFTYSVGRYKKHRVKYYNYTAIIVWLNRRHFLCFLRHILGHDYMLKDMNHILFL